MWVHRRRANNLSVPMSLSESRRLVPRDWSWLIGSVRSSPALRFSAGCECRCCKAAAPEEISETDIGSKRVPFWIHRRKDPNARRARRRPAPASPRPNRVGPARLLNFACVEMCPVKNDCRSLHGLAADFGTRDTKASGPGAPESENRQAGRFRGARESSFRRSHGRSASIGRPIQSREKTKASVPCWRCEISSNCQFDDRSRVFVHC